MSNKVSSKSRYLYLGRTMATAISLHSDNNIISKTGEKVKNVSIVGLPNTPY